MEKVSFFGYWIPYLSAYQLQGYPPPKLILPALEAVGYNVDFVNVYDIAQLKVSPLERGEAETADDLRRALASCRSNKLIVSYWDYIYKRDIHSLFSDPSKKIIFSCNWHEEKKPYAHKLAILRNASFTTVSLDSYRDQWIKEIGPEAAAKYGHKLKVLRFPCTLGAPLDREACRKQIGITTNKSILLWGYYGAGKGHEDIIKWASTMFETSVLFAGTPASSSAGEYLLAKAIELNMKDRVFFSRPLISDEEADLWFGAADLVLIPYWHKVGESALSYALGHGKACITSKLECFPEYEDKFGAIVTSDKIDFKETIEHYLNYDGHRKELEVRAKAYAQKFNWTTAAIEYKKLLNQM